MPLIPGTIPLTGQVAPTDTTDIYPTHDATYGAGGHRTVVDHTARNAITNGRRQQGMLVFTMNDGATWQLNASPWVGDDTDWSEFVGGGGSIAPIFFAYGDAAHTVWTPSANGYLTFATVKITTAFNGAGASIDLGAVKPANYTDPTTVAEYESSPDLYLAAGTPIVLTIVQGAGATQGAGILFLTFVPE